MNLPEIQELKTMVEQKYGKALETTNDFNDFTSDLRKEVAEGVSSSTLKRLWGYVGGNHTTRKYTLNLLARYLGYRNYDAFLTFLKSTMKFNSSFVSAQMICSADLQKGQRMNIGWGPDRLVTLLYHGNNEFTVEQNANSKLRIGDRFIAGCFIYGEPLYLPYLDRGCERTAPYLAGRNDGLTVVELLDK